MHHLINGSKRAPSTWEAATPASIGLRGTVARAETCRMEQQLCTSTQA